MCFICLTIEGRRLVRGQCRDFKGRTTEYKGGMKEEMEQEMRGRQSKGECMKRFN